MSFGVRRWRSAGQWTMAYTLDQQFVAGNQVIRSITFTLQPDAETPNLQWYEHQTHHTGRLVFE
jgi:hypothetical protein